jgi:hypothetical protein
VVDDFLISILLRFSGQGLSGYARQEGKPINYRQWYVGPVVSCDTNLAISSFAISKWI